MTKTPRIRRINLERCLVFLEGVRPYQPVRDTVFCSLKKAILRGHFQPGERLVEHELAQQMDISRTPIREALRKLELEGLVDYVPRKGVVVVGITAADAAKIYTICAVLEGLAARLAAEKRTDKEVSRLKNMLVEMEAFIQTGNINRLHIVHTHFHHFIARISKSPRLYQRIVALREHVENFKETFYSRPERLQDGWKEHEAIVRAIQNADAEKAECAAKNHLVHVTKTFSKGMERSQEQKVSI
jgi:DNA-binding GntR family transcriptional regulator